MCFACWLEPGVGLVTSEEKAQTNEDLGSPDFNSATTDVINGHLQPHPGDCLHYWALLPKAVSQYAEN